MRVFTNWYYSQIWFNIQQWFPTITGVHQLLHYCIFWCANFKHAMLHKEKKKGGWYKQKGSRENEEYTWINLSAREALSYKTKISTKDSRDKPEDSLKHTKKNIWLIHRRNAMFVSPPEMFDGLQTAARIRGRKGTLHADVGEKLQISWWQGEKSGSERT